MMNSKKKIVIFIIFWVIVITMSFYTWQIVSNPNILVNKEESEYIIIPSRIFENGQQRKTVYKDVINIFKNKKIITNLLSFVLLSKITGLHEQYKPGRYKITPNMSNLALIRLIKSGLQTPLNVSINNVRLVEELADKVSNSLDMTKEEFLSAFNDSDTQKKYGFNDKNFLCAFLPNTYQLYYTILPKSLIKRMLIEYDKFWSDERREKAAKNKLTPLDVCTLASIVQAETIKNKEFSRVAGLYYNRLKKRIKLQADPTVVYATKKFKTRRVTLKMLKVKSPYNTYLNLGLPPGPINMPTLQVTNAVLNLEQHNYIYMCSKSDFSGYHDFAVTYKEHIKNAKRFRRALDIRKIFK